MLKYSFYLLKKQKSFCFLYTFLIFSYICPNYHLKH